MIGETVSHYRITRQLGAGGMGVVYEAIDTNLDRTVALKFLPPESTRDPEAKARFIHEAKAASALDHPNVCTVHDIGETDDGQMFLAMACYTGETLKEKIARGPLPLDEAIDITRQIAEGLQTAHEKEIVHRDIKPANIFVTDTGLVKILDFGLAKLAGQTQLTQTGTTLGTAHYMSPEQAQGKATDRRSDLWGLGALLYEMVSGRVPFAGEYAQAVAYGILNEEPEPVTGLRTGVPMALERIIGKCLAKDSAERYQHAEDLLADVRTLQRQAGGRLTMTTRVGVSSGAGPRRWPWAIGFVAVAIVGSTVAVLVFGSGRDGRPGDTSEHAVAVVDFRELQAPDGALAAAGLTELVNIGLVENCPIRVVSPEYLQDLRRRLFGPGAGLIEDGQILEVARKAGATFLLAGRISRVEDEQFVTWRLVDTRNGKSVEARKVEGGRLSGIVNQIVAGVVPAIAEACGIAAVDSQVAVGGITTESSEAFDHYISGLLGIRTGGSLDKARDDLEKAVAADSSFALAHLELGRFFQSVAAGHRNPANARLHLEKAELLRARLGTRDRLRLEAARFQQRSQVASSISTYEKIRALWPDDKEALEELMWLYWLYWDFRASGLIAQEGLDLYPDHHQDFIQTYIDMLMSTGRPREALRAARENAERDPDDPRSWALVAKALLASGEPDSAAAAQLKAAEIDGSYWSTDWAYWYAYFSGDLDRAIALLKERLSDDGLVDSQRIWLMAVMTITPSLSAMYYERGQFEEMLKTVDEARQFSRGNPVGWEFNKAVALLCAGRAQEALELAEELPRRYDDSGAVWLGLRIRARALTALGELDAARGAVAEIYASQDRYGGMARTIALKAEADIALAEHDPGGALASVDKMLEQGIPGFGPFGIAYLETRAHALQMAGRLTEAVAVHERLLRVHRGRALSRYELGKLYEQMGQADRAEEEYSKFLDMWSEADEGLPQLAEAASRLTALEASQ